MAAIPSETAPKDTGEKKDAGERKTAEDLKVVRDLKHYPSDHRRYRYLELQNGLKVLLIENRRATVSQAVFEVSAGSFHEPDQYPGLAHFLEHMVAVGGTQKYPEIDGDDKFIAAHRGESNAMTSAEKTRYVFTILPEAFNEALDRCAQFFIAPRLTQKGFAFDDSCIQRELSAVQHEFSLKVPKDVYRYSCVEAQTTNPKHPGARFKCGNRDTLKESEMPQILEAMRAFYHTHYTADRMTVVLESPHALSELTHLAQIHFANIARAKAQVPPLNKAPQYRESDLGLFIQLTSVQNNRSLNLLFILPMQRSPELERALSYINLALGNSEDGGLFATLKQKDWISDGLILIQYSDGDYQPQVLFAFALTEQGVLKLQDIKQAVFQYIQFIRKQGMDIRLYEEMRDREKRDILLEAYTFNNSLFRFLDNLKFYPVDKFFDGSMILDSAFPEAMIGQILDELTPQNMRQILTAKGIKGNKKEPYTGAEYSVERLSELKLQREVQVMAFKARTPQKVSFPAVSHLDVPADKFRRPTLVYSAPRLRVWFSQDHHFKQPTVITDCYFNSSFATETLQNAILSQIYLSLITDELREKHDSSFAAKNNRLSAASNSKGLMVRIDGFPNHHEEAFGILLDTAQGLNVKLADFEKHKVQFIQAFQHHMTEGPIVHCKEIIDELLDHHNYPNEKYNVALKGIQFKDLQNFIHRML